MTRVLQALKIAALLGTASLAFGQNVFPPSASSGSGSGLPVATFASSPSHKPSCASNATGCAYLFTDSNGLCAGGGASSQICMDNGTSWLSVTPLPGTGLDLVCGTTCSLQIDPGWPGVTGPGYAASSTTSLTVQTGSTGNITTQSGLAYTAGIPCLLVDTANTANWMWGTVTSYSSTTLVCNISLVGGSGSGIATWSISASQAPTSGSGSVSSVGLSAPAQFSVSGTPVTVNGTLALGWANSGADQVLVGSAANTMAYQTMPSCTGTGQSLQYSTTSHTYTCLTTTIDYYNPAGDSPANWTTTGGATTAGKLACSDYYISRPVTFTYFGFATQTADTNVSDSYDIYLLASNGSVVANIGSTTGGSGWTTPSGLKHIATAQGSQTIAAGHYWSCLAGNATTLKVGVSTNAYIALYNFQTVTNSTWTSGSGLTAFTPPTLTGQNASRMLLVLSAN